MKVRIAQLCPTLCDLMDCIVHGILQAGILGWVAIHFLLQGIVPTQGSNPGFPHCRWILYRLSYRGSLRILKWVAYPFSGDCPNPGFELGSPTLQVDSLPTELSGKPSVPKDLHFKTNLSPRNHGVGGHGTTLWELLVLAKSSLDSPP